MKAVPDTWLRQIEENLALAAAGATPDAFAVVSGSPADARHWAEHFHHHAADLFGGADPGRIRSLVEAVPKGSLLGTLAAWAELRDEVPADGITLLSLLFGAGKRLSPFTQALGNRKAALRVPRRGPVTGDFLAVADLVVMFSTSLVEFLRTAGFRGALIRWGDEVQLPGVDFPEPGDLPGPLDGFRLAWFTDPTPQLAVEKDWLVVDPGTGLLAATLPRQPQESLLRRLEAMDMAGHRLAVNLGSLAVSSHLLDAAADVFAAEVADPSARVDWDPYFWVAFQTDEPGWDAARAAEAELGRTGIARLETALPAFAAKARAVRGRLADSAGRPPAVYVVDYGTPYWFDCGLQPTLRRALLSLTRATPEGAATRALLDVPAAPDAAGNRIVGSHVAPGAALRNSVVIDSEITSPAAVLDGAVVVGSRLAEARIPRSGAALFCDVAGRFDLGDAAVAYDTAGADLEVPDRGRITRLATVPGAPIMMGSEDLADLSGADYEHPVLGNPMSFADAARAVAAGANGLG